jgi:hypothetical protein
MGAGNSVPRIHSRVRGPHGREACAGVSPQGRCTVSLPAWSSVGVTPVSSLPRSLCTSYSLRTPNKTAEVTRTPEGVGSEGSVLLGAPSPALTTRPASGGGPVRPGWHHKPRRSPRGASITRPRVRSVRTHHEAPAISSRRRVRRARLAAHHEASSTYREARRVDLASLDAHHEPQHLPRPPCCTYVAGACGMGWPRTGRHGTRRGNDSKPFRAVTR